MYVCEGGIGEERVNKIERVPLTGSAACVRASRRDIGQYKGKVGPFREIVLFTEKRVST